MSGGGSQKKIKAWRKRGRNDERKKKDSGKKRKHPKEYLSMSLTFTQLLAGLSTGCEGR